MAKIVESVIIIKFSSIVKDTEELTALIITDDVKTALEQVAQELAGNNVVVEVETV